ncbi:hypothetical protein MJA45_07825 [Paenibacillus aurantius]|uniref:Uncharacterized protein n=1 Tax=Paenibacillus aurantius TaxID=2918900 RepID=A0AA96RGX0_9BACL|nr:hypothetical protein [Paenibacillus aurantius]WNQ12926.1 hypothetical protein MJA45_07825 [Paenibacillus aurantius]
MARILLFGRQTDTIGVGGFGRERNTIEQPNKDNVILFPKTIDFYQIELTRMLETERYGEAMNLLRFLLQCESGDPRADEEWAALLGWLETMRPEETGDSAGEEPEESETDMLSRAVKDKAEADSRYVDRLLQSLFSGTSVEKMLLALEQLTYAEHPGINAALIQWLRTAKLHPIVLFKGLQALKRRGAEGPVTFSRQGKIQQLDIEDTPLSLADFPPKFSEIIGRVQQISEVKEPTLSYFAEHTWADFLAFIYGSPAYDSLLSRSQDEMDVWAAALHAVIQESMQGGADVEEIREMYGITSENKDHWKQAYEVMQNFMRSVKPV